MAIFKNSNDEKVKVAFRDAFIIFCYTFLAALLVIEGIPSVEDLYFVFLLSASAFLISLAGALDVKLQPDGGSKKPYWLRHVNHRK